MQCIYSEVSALQPSLFTYAAVALPVRVCVCKGVGEKGVVYVSFTHKFMGLEICLHTVSCSSFYSKPEREGER